MEEEGGRAIRLRGPAPIERCSHIARSRDLADTVGERVRLPSAGQSFQCERSSDLFVAGDGRAKDGLATATRVVVLILLDWIKLRIFCHGLHTDVTWTLL